MTGPVLMPGPMRSTSLGRSMLAVLNRALSPSMTTVSLCSFMLCIPKVRADPFSPACWMNMRASPACSTMSSLTGLPFSTAWALVTMSNRSANFLRTMPTVLPAIGSSSAYGPLETLTFLFSGRSEPPKAVGGVDGLTGRCFFCSFIAVLCFLLFVSLPW